MNDETLLKQAIYNGDIGKLNHFSESIPDFPNGREPVIERKWFEVIVTQGAMASVVWLATNHREEISSYEVESGSSDLPPVHAALDREDSLKHEILKIILEAGADPDARGFHDYTPGHRAALGNDCVALELLSQAGADFNIKTRIDDYLNAKDEALSFVGSNDATKFLERWHKQKEGQIEDAS